MYTLHLWHVVEDLQSDRRAEARERSLRRLCARSERAQRQAAGDQAGALRQAVAFVLIEAGLRLLTPRAPVQVRRVR